MFQYKNFPGGPVVKNLPANAGDIRGSHMVWGNWVHAPELPSPQAQSLCSATREATTLESLATTTKNTLSRVRLFATP